MKAYCVFMMEEIGPKHYMEIVSERLLKIFDSKEKAISYIESNYKEKVDRERDMLILSHSISTSTNSVYNEKTEHIEYLSISEIEIE